MTDLTDRQKHLLKLIIEIYVKSGEPVASELIEKTGSLGVSPATIRNEMAKLTESGFLKQLHTSAGRIPTSIGFRLYIAELMKEKEVSVMDEVTIRQQVMDVKSEYNKMIKIATKALAKKCDALALALQDGEVYYAGAANILNTPEFYDIDVTRFVLSLFDEYAILQQIINMAHGSDPLHIIFGEETGYEYLRPTSFAFINYDSRFGNPGVIGVIGPDRLNFPLVLPYLRYIGKVLSEA